MEENSKCLNLIIELKIKNIIKFYFITLSFKMYQKLYSKLISCLVTYSEFLTLYEFFSQISTNSSNIVFSIKIPENLQKMFVNNTLQKPLQKLKHKSLNFDEKSLFILVKFAVVVIK